MPLSTGNKLGPYEILSPLGAGGMGEVYRARDTRLDRAVAVKVLPSHLSSNPELRQRFEREARAISSLSHPNICTLHDIGSQDGVDYLVMEYLDGETLAARLQRGTLPAADLMRCAIEIADALDRAHRQGVVHRDLKPGNIMLTKSGAKLLDFGLARTVATATGSTMMTTSPTMITPLTAQGSIVGTFQYMAPEQLEGKEADARTDLFAFGAILYEMATGNRAFSGATQASLIAAILKEEPRPVAQVSPQVPFALQRIIEGCLAKDPEERWQNAGDLRRELKWIAGGGVVSGVEPRPALPEPRRRLPFWLLMPASAILAASLVVAGYWMRQTAPARLLRVAVPLAEGTLLDGENPALALSPDGRLLAFVASTPKDRIRVWVRPMDGMMAQPLAGTDGASYPFWSPDGRSIGFFADGRLKRIPVTGGAAQTLCDAPDPRGASWSSKGMIAFAPAPFGGLSIVPATGGTPVSLTQPDAEGVSHRMPQFLPDGDRLIFFNGAAPSGLSNVIMSLDVSSRSIAPVAQENSGGQFAPPSHLAFVREGNLMVQPIDMKTLKLSGEAVPVAEGVRFNPNRWAGQFSFSAGGLLAFETGGGGDRKLQLTWFDLEGKALGTVGTPAPITSLSMSPEGKRAAVVVQAATSGDIWIYDLTRGLGTRFTFAKSGLFHSSPVWSPDGKEIAFVTTEGQVMVKAADGGTTARVIYTGPVVNRETDSWSPDGKLLTMRVQSGTAYDEWILPIDGKSEPTKILATPASEAYGRFSPDGRRLSYISNESGRDELYVIPFPGPGGKWQVSTGGAQDGLWLGGGRGILIKSLEGRLMTVEIQADGSNLQIGEPRSIFGGASLRDPMALWPDGTRLLAAVATTNTGTPALNLVVNWNAALAQP